MVKTLCPGDILDGRYELLVRHAQGGMATVWVARVRGGFGFERVVAVKTILPHLAGDAQFRDMFLDEARIASRIRHPNVVHLDDVGESEGVPFMVLEWIEGDPLAQISDQAGKSQGTIPHGVLLRIAIEACLGLHAAHELRDPSGQLLNVVHRDVSHQNLLVTTEGVTKVIDFGIAKAVHRLSENTRTGLIKGKLEYSAPEYLRQRLFDRRADVWAMGVILYRELAGRFPFEAPSDAALLGAITAGASPPPLPPSVPQALAEVVLRALQHDLARRYPTALDMARALEATMAEKCGQAEVAAYVNDLLAARIEIRRRFLARALSRPGEGGGAHPHRPNASAPLAELPPEAVSLRPERADELLDARLADPSDLPDSMVAPIAPRLAFRHAFAMFVATAITLSIWGFVAVVLRTSPKLHPAAAAPARGIP